METIIVIQTTKQQDVGSLPGNSTSRQLDYLWWKWTADGTINNSEAGMKTTMFF